jgi:hypothetical protein
MSTVARRLERLERRLGGLCPACARQPARIELVDAADPDRQPQGRLLGACPDCGHTPELIQVRLNLRSRPRRPRAEPETAA